MKKYVAYYRTSTTRQNLGLDAQKAACEAFIDGLVDAELIAEYSEQESGKNDNRPELEKAVTLCKEVGAVLLVAKLDRLTRSIAFGFQLRESGVRIRALNCPEFGDDATLLLSVMLGLAQQERELISQRTKDALKARRAQGVRLGSPQNLTDKDRAKGAMTHTENAMKSEANKQAYALVKALKAQGQSNASITRKLNECGFKTPRHKEWTNAGVARLLKLMAKTTATE